MWASSAKPWTLARRRSVATCALMTKTRPGASTAARKRRRHHQRCLLWRLLPHRRQRRGSCPAAAWHLYSVVGPGVILYDDLPDRTLVTAKQELVTRPWGPERYGWSGCISHFGNCRFLTCGSGRASLCDATCMSPIDRSFPQLLSRLLL